MFNLSDNINTIKHLDDEGLQIALALLKNIFDAKVNISDLVTKQDALTAGANISIGMANGTLTISASYPEATASAAGLLSASDKTKINGIEAGADVNVQADWEQEDNTADDYIKNKPTNLVTSSDMNTALLTKVDVSGAVTGVKGSAESSYRTGNIAISKANIGLANVDNTSDLAKPVSTATQTALDSKLNSSLKGANNGIAELDENGKVPSSQLPSYVDDVLEYAALASFPATGESGKIYVDTTTNKTYRWSGSVYTEISASLALGDTSSTAYWGDKGKVAYNHASETKLSTATASGLYKVAATANGHIVSLTAVTKSDITGLGIPAQDTTYTAATAAPGNIATAGAKGSSTNYARQDHTHGITLATGDSNGQVKIAGQNVSVKGLGSMAYQSSLYEVLFDSANGTDVTNSSPSLSFSSGKSLTGYTDGYLKIFFLQNNGVNSVETIITNGAIKNIQLLKWDYDSSETTLSLISCIGSVSNGNTITFSNSENASFTFKIYRIVAYK